MGGWLGAALLGLSLACGLSSTATYRVEGVVRGVDAEHLQLRVEHEAIPGFMPEMTMSFDLAEPSLLDGIEVGLRIRFLLERSGTTLRVTAIDVIGRAPDTPGVGALGAPDFDEAPGFELMDHTGAVFSLSELEGHAVLLDFIFTRCAGPCPILTRAHADLQHRLPGDLAERTRLVSISIDPEHDTPERLEAYARERGADLETWSFLTGTPGQVQSVLDAYHVGTIRRPDGTLDHVVATFLIGPDGRIAERYLADCCRYLVLRRRFSRTEAGHRRR